MLEELKKELADFGKTVSEGFKTEIKGLTDKISEVETKYAKGEEVTALKTSLEGIETTLQEMKQEAAARGVGADPNDGKSFHQVLQAKLIEVLGETKDSDKRRAVKAAFAAKNLNINFEAKAAVTMTRPLVNPTAGSRIPAWQREVGVAKSPDNTPFVSDLVTIGALPASDTISWVERISRDGGAAAMNEGDTYGKVSMEYQEFSAKAHKIGVMAKASKESLDDIDFLLSEIQNEIIDGEDGLNNTLDRGLLSGTGIAPELKGILNYAVSFAKPAGLTAVANPTIFDLVRTVALQGALAKRRFNYILLNPVQVAQMELTKDANDNYVIPPFVDANGRKIGGITIVENVGMAAGTFLAGEFSKSGLFIRKGIEIAIATENEDDWVKDFVSIKGSLRAVHRIKGVDANAFVKGTISTALAAIGS